MRTITLFAAVAAVFSTAPTAGQEAGRAVPAVLTGQPGGVVGGVVDGIGPGRFDPADVIKRLFSLDKDADGRLARAEFPERMQGLVERVDSDSDDIVNKEEVDRFVRLAASARPNPPSSPKKAATIADIVNDLRLPQPKHDLAIEVAKKYNGNDPRTAGELHNRMREVLDNEEYENFMAAAARLKHSGQFGFRID